MREIRSSGSVRGVRSNSYPYRDHEYLEGQRNTPARRFILSQNLWGIEQRIPPFLRSERPNCSLRRKDGAPAVMVRDKGSRQSLGHPSCWYRVPRQRFFR